MSDDGNWVTFSSYAHELVDGMTTHQPQVYRQFQVTGALALVSVGVDGQPGNRDSYASYVSAGRTVRRVRNPLATN